MTSIDAVRSSAALVCLTVVSLSWSGTTAVQAQARDESNRPEWMRFEKTGVEFLKTYCMDCHGPTDPEAGLSLNELMSQETLLTSRKRWDAIVRMVDSGQMPPRDVEAPPREAVQAWVKLARATLDEADRFAPRDPGRVTVRRLNRTEYNNTIRDLVGVDFNPAEDFPADDIGHGFDNIGDVLTLSPVLMERYLAAAESIMQRAIVPNPPAPPKRHIASRYCEPAGGDVKPDRFRPISSAEGLKPTESGPLFTRYQVPEGEYVFRTRVYAESSDDQPVRMVVLLKRVDGRTDGLGDRSVATDLEAQRISGAAVNSLKPFVVLEEVVIKARTAEEAEQIEVKVPWVEGLERMAVGLIRPDGDTSIHRLFIEHLALEGPLDTRPASQRMLMACDANADHASQTREILQRFTSRAYRRPVRDEELARLVGLVESLEGSGKSWEESIQFAMQAVLVSPKFLFRLELNHGDRTGEFEQLDEFALATRLSYFLWSSMPDDELFELADSNQLRANLEPQVRRMLADAKSSALVDQFALQWLQLKRLETFAPDRDLFPAFDDRLKSSMQEETRLFLKTIIEEDRNVLELLSSDFTFVNEPLARHYGIRDTAGNIEGQDASRPGGKPIRGREFVRVNVEGTLRGGLLTQASVLTVTSNPTRTSPVKRGRWVLEQLLGTPPPPPPPNVPELDAGGRQLTGSLRERMEQHRENPSCAACHATMDPLGFAFENFDAIGRYRERDGDHMIDPSGELPGGITFSGPDQLKELLVSQRDDFYRCLAEKMLIYSTGRGLEYYDRRAVNEIVSRLKNGDGRFSALILAIVQSDPFRMRRL